jgi:hypothetical protein
MMTLKRKGMLSMGRIIALAFALLVQTSHAETIQKHHRVAEMEDELRQKAGNYLKTRFPEQPFLVNVSVDPLRRNTPKTQSGETLPFFDTVTEEILDEWDDPNLSLQQLQLRTVKIVVDVSLSNSTSDNEIAEVKENIFKSLHLTPARDEVKIETRNWNQSSNRYMIGLMALGISALFLIGLYFINRQSTQKITRALAEGAKNTNASMNGPMTLAPVTSSTNNSNEDSGKADSSGPKHGVELSDPIKISEILSKTIDQLQEKKEFPSLQAMITLDELGKHNPGKLGAILSELPIQIRNKLFSLSTGEWWFNAMMKSDRFELSHLEVLQRIAREIDSGRSPAMEKMLVNVWRLNDQLPHFIRSQKRPIGMAILSQLPKGKAIEAARKAYPGAWADLLDPSIVHLEISDAECEAISTEALTKVPLRNLQAFEKHKTEMELREYLLNASVDEEREIYIASKPDSAIHSHRPPFFKVLDAEDELLATFVTRFTPEQWAWALFNVSQNEKKKIQKFFSEKQNFMFTENLKRQDRSNDHSQVGRTREYLGSEFKKYKAEMEAEAIKVMSEMKVPDQGTIDSDNEIKKNAA